MARRVALTSVPPRLFNNPLLIPHGTSNTVGNTRMANKIKELEDRFRHEFTPGQHAEIARLEGLHMNGGPSSTVSFTPKRRPRKQTHPRRKRPNPTDDMGDAELDALMDAANARVTSAAKKRRRPRRKRQALPLGVKEYITLNSFLRKVPVEHRRYRLPITRGMTMTSYLRRLGQKLGWTRVRLDQLLWA